VAGHHSRYRLWKATGGLTPRTTDGMIVTSEVARLETVGWFAAWSV
jgi:hypothetical protein